MTMRQTIILVVALAICQAAGAQNGRIVTDEWLEKNYTKRETMIEVRDGAHLYTAIYEPTAEYASSIGLRKVPMMIMRTPYSLKPYGALSEKPHASGFASQLKGDLANYVADGYIIVLQNVRGKYLSEGTYENMRPYLSGERGAVDTITISGSEGTAPRILTDEATDIYDSVEWLLANTECDGNVGVKGVSYPGFYATAAALSRHPAIKAVSPQAPATDWFMGDDAHHNGALCLTDTYRFGGGFYRERKKPSTKGLPSLVTIDEDIYDYFKGKPMHSLDAFFGDSLRFWSEMTEHPDYDEFWQMRDPSVHLKGIRIPMLVTGGFYDAEDCYGTFRTYYMLKALSPECDLHLAAGPWYHGGWNNRTADHLSGAWFGEASGAYYQDNVEYPFFAWYLTGKGSRPANVNVLPSGETMQTVMDGKSSDGLWQTYDEWPPKEMRYMKMFLSGKDELTTGKAERYSRTIVSDPSSPVPYMDIKAKSRDRAYMAADQRFASMRSDVATYKLRQQEAPLHLAGPVKVHIELSLDSDGGKRDLDGDIIVKLIDVRPDGYQMLVRGDVMPLRFRDGFDEPKPSKAGRRISVEFTMCDIDHIFEPGHSLMVQIQGSWFPLIAMNPQSFIRNTYKAEASDYQTIDITIASKSSYLELPVCQ